MTDERDMNDRQTEGGGASIRHYDPRVSRVRDWAWSIIGAGIIGASLLAANNLYQLNLTVARGVANDAIAELRYQDHEARLRQNERDISAIEGKVFRSGFDPTKEPARGR